MSTGPQVVPAYDPFALASGGFESVQEDWMPASHCRPLVQEDPCVLWLEWYGDKYGFTPSTLNGSSYSALAEISEQFDLTQRERETVEFLLQGLTSKEIATRMQISPNTVKAFLRLVMVKMKVSTRSGIAGKLAGSRPNA